MLSRANINESCAKSRYNLRIINTYSNLLLYSCEYVCYLLICSLARVKHFIYLCNNQTSNPSDYGQNEQQTYSINKSWG